MSLLEQAEALANELRFAEYVRNKLDGIRMVHEHERQTFERILRLAAERICQRCRGYGKTASGCHCGTCDGLGMLPVGKAPAPERVAELIKALRAERDGYRSQVQSARESISSQYNKADYIAANFAVPHGADRTSYLLRSALAEVRDSMNCRQDCDRWHGGKHSWE